MVPFIQFGNGMMSGQVKLNGNYGHVIVLQRPNVGIVTFVGVYKFSCNPKVGLA
jgi:hypothetical protein